MNELKFGPIKNKMQEVIVEGQVAPGCLCDCTHYIWTGSKSSKKKGCWRKTYYDAHSSRKS